MRRNWGWLFLFAIAGTTLKPDNTDAQVIAKKQVRIEQNKAWLYKSNVVTLNGKHWSIAPQAEIKEGGEQISSDDYVPKEWMKATVPGTVFGAYVEAGKEQEPTYGDNAYRVDQTKYDRNFWYRTTFVTPANYNDGITWLNIDGINRDADIYLNGKKLGSLHGFMQRGRFDISALTKVGAQNSLAILDYVPLLQTKMIEKDNSRENSTSPAFICSKGWDWMPRVPGLNMGIYKDVYLSHTDAVSIIDPWIRSDLPNLPDTNTATLSVQTDLINNADRAITGALTGEIIPGNIKFTYPVTLNAKETRTIKFDAKTVAALKIIKPKLWWPNGYGTPNLYTCKLSFRLGNSVSDKKDIRFGIRKFTYTTVDSILRVHINGVPLFLKGGNWGMAEFMLRCTEKEFETRLKLHREMNYNIIRDWMGMIPDRAFYDACDKYGMMIWNDFWLNSSGGNPDSLELFRANAIENIKQIRNHPAIALWCGENERAPLEPINSWLREDIATYDGGDRYYQPNSHAENLSGSGPWNNLDPNSISREQ